MVARLVIAIGTKRDARGVDDRLDRRRALARSARFASSTSRMPFETAMPMTMSTPISAVIEKPCPAAISAQHDADERHGDREEHDERQAQRLELRRHDHEHDHHGEAEREAEAARTSCASAPPDRRSRP